VGFVVIDKPVGVTSFSMVALVRRLTGVRRVGHAGTLDPLASGVLPVAVGQATRFIEYLDDAAKTYVAEVQFGAETDTYDAEGEVVGRGDASGLTQAGIETALGAFEGEIEQTPPTYSALKLAGKPLYRYAREGVDVEVRPRIVRVDSARVLAFDATASRATIEVVCGKGTYIRSVAHDLGRALGCGAHLAALRRTSSGGFGIEDAHTPDALAALAERGEFADAMLAADRAVERRPAAILGGVHAADVRAGRNVGLDARAGREAADLCRAYSVEGEFVGVLRLRAEGVWHPEKVLPAG
jgi:tRNA pseudouridine55 synthase